MRPKVGKKCVRNFAPEQLTAEMAKDNRKKAAGEQLSPDMKSHIVAVSTPANIYTLYTGEFAGLKSDNLKFYFEQARKGVSFFMSLLSEDIRQKDLRLGAVCQTRKLAVTRKPWRISYREESPLSEPVKKELSAMVYDVLESLDTPGLMADIVEAQIQGLSAFETVYKLDGSYMLIDEVCRIQNHLLTFDDLTNTYGILAEDKVDTTLMRLKGRSSAEDRIDVKSLNMPPLDPSKFTIATGQDGNSANAFLNGCTVSLIWYYFFKNYGLKDWASYVERFATPAVVGKYPPLMSSADRQMLKSAVQNFGHLLRVVIPDGASLDFLKDSSSASSNEIFDRYTAYWDKGATIRVLGQSLTTDIGDVGSKAAAQTHDAVRNDLVVSDMMLVQSTMNKLIRKMLDLNYEQLGEYPKFVFEEMADIEYKLKRSQIAVNLRQAGYVPAKEELEKEFGWALEDATASGAANTDEDATNRYITKFIEEFYNGIHG